jgi:dephospho-CoA kinase
MFKHDFFVVGLTGGLASGKSLVSQFFATKGINVLDADVIVRNLHQDPTIQQKIQQQFGTLDRTGLRELIFHDVKAKQWLEQLLQPLVLDHIAQWQVPTSSPYAVLVAPLLIETNLHHQVDKVLVIDCDPSQQVLRATARDQISTTLAERIIAQQISREQRLQHADDVILNNGTLNELSAQIDLLHQQYLQLAQHRH